MQAKMSWVKSALWEWNLASLLLIKAFLSTRTKTQAVSFAFPFLILLEWPFGACICSLLLLWQVTHKFSVITQYKLIILQFWRSVIYSGSCWHKIQVLESSRFLWSIKRKIWFLSFPVFGGCPHSLSCGSRHLQSQQWRVWSFSACLMRTLTFCPPLSHLKDPRDYTGFT